jgi:nitroimidazol reductase NimA-like FMN-containing flavoprotein (pyridoxamine 5'-phosphate oxidase superfamily)
VVEFLGTRTVRRSDKEVTDPDEIERIINSALVCRLGLCEGDQPYVVPVCFGYEAGRIYIHSYPSGKKMEIIRKNPRVCIEIDSGIEPVPAESPCGRGMKYRSVIAFGTCRILSGKDEKKNALKVILEHYVAINEDIPDFSPDGVAVISIDIETITGKKSV